MLSTTKRSDCPFRLSIAVVFFLLSAVSAGAQQASPLSSPKQEQKTNGASLIRGRVIYADTGRPLRRAEVSLVAQDSGNWAEPSVTDRNGEFVFANIGSGKYFVLVSAADIVSPLQKMGSIGSLTLRIALGQIEDGFSEVTVDGRGSVKTEIRASRGGVITGRVMSESDEPIAKAEIKLFQIEDGRLFPATTKYVLDRDKRMFETDSRGIYRIAGLAAGEYVVRASESDEGGNPDDAAEGSYTDGSMMVAYHPKALRVQDATIVKVQQGSETRDVDIRLPDRSVHRVSGTVVVRGLPVRSAEIRLTRGEPEIDSNSFRSAQARTDSDGHWEIRAVPDGDYTLSVSGFIIGMVQLRDEKGYATVVPQRHELIVSGSDVTDLKFELVEGGTLQGAVSVEGRAQLPDRLMIELVSADLRSRSPALNPAAGTESKSSEAQNTDSGAAGSAFVKENGIFSVLQLPSGLFQFRIQGLGTSLYVKSITLNGKDLLRNPVKIEERKTLDGVRIVLSTEVVSLSGQAVEKGVRGKPLTDAAILLFPVEVERRRISDGPLVARTDKEGRFVVKGAPGEYFVFVFDRRRKGIPLMTPTEATLIKNSGTLQKIRLQPGAEKGIVEVVGP